MFENESKELVSATKSLDFIRKLSPSNRRDQLILKIEKWLEDSLESDKSNIDNQRYEISYLITKINSLKSKFLAKTLTSSDFSA